jgi:hypothetical protein
MELFDHKSQAGIAMSEDKIISEARAKIIWGEPSCTVRDFLVANHISPAVAEAKLREFEFERNRELRKMGLRNLLIGSILTGAAGITLYLAFAIASATSGIIKALAVVLLAGVYGSWKLVKGVVYLVRPQSEHRSIPDLYLSDLIE